MPLREWFYEKFIASPVYTPEATILYAVLLVGAVWFVYYKLLKALRVRVDTKFVSALVPFIILAALLRNVGDTLLVTQGKTGLTFFFITPGVYITAFVVALASLVFATRTKTYWKTMVTLGTVFSLGVLAYLVGFGIPNVRGALIAVGIAALWIPALYIIQKTFPKYLTKQNAALLWAHMLDASATFTALALHTGLFEEHVLPRFLISTLGLGPAVMFALKLAVVWPVLYYIDKEKDAEYRTWLKIVVLALGFALGVRDVITIGMLGTLNV